MQFTKNRWAIQKENITNGMTDIYTGDIAKFENVHEKMELKG